MDKYHIPQNLDQPPKIILWTFDEMAVFMLPFLMSFLIFNAPTIGILIGVFMVVSLKKIKGEEGHYFLKHLAYWYLPPVIHYSATPKSYIREILG